MPEKAKHPKAKAPIRTSARAAKQPVNQPAGETESSPLVRMTRKFAEQVEQLSFSPPAQYVYNPLLYAREPHEQYLHLYGRGEKKVLFVGMNPGPWGMVQTGIPFGEITVVKEWLKIEGKVESPPRTHPKRPVDGFRCTRHEPSGRRLWGLMRERFETPANFFKDHFVVNYCPLAFFDGEGKNVTPDKLPKHERTPLLDTCAFFLGETIKLLQPLFVIGVGQFALNQIEETIRLLTRSQAAHPATRQRPPGEIITGKILHPSPSNPAANYGWAVQATRQLTDLGVWG